MKKIIVIATLLFVTDLCAMKLPQSSSTQRRGVESAATPASLAGIAQNLRALDDPFMDMLVACDSCCRTAARWAVFGTAISCTLLCAVYASSAR